MHAQWVLQEFGDRYAVGPRFRALWYGRNSTICEIRRVLIVVLQFSGEVCQRVP